MHFRKKQRGDMHAPIKLFLALAHLWVIGFIVSLIPMGEWLWVHPVSPALPASGGLAYFNQAFDAWLPGDAVYIAVPVLLVLCVWNLFRAHWLRSLLIWALFTSLMDRAWLAGSGGQQLMSILLFWSIFFPLERSNSAWKQGVVLFAFWAARLQIVLVYAATAAHKWTGNTWTTGEAVRIVATDPTYHLGWLASFPMACSLLTWGLLFFMTLFPLAMWWSPSRRSFLLAGTLFHLSTSLFLDIPEMGLAFVASYALWLSPEEAECLLGKVILSVRNVRVTFNKLTS